MIVTGKYAHRFTGVNQDWPMWALVAALFADDQDRGVGDTIARLVGPPRSEGWKRYHEAAFGVWVEPCGCAGEQADWNRLYNYRA
jgi:hypothetical protein